MLGLFQKKGFSTHVWFKKRKNPYNTNGTTDIIASYDGLDFNKNWNSLMVAIKFIEKQFYFVDILGCNICTIKGIKGKTKNPHVSVASDDKQEAVFTAVSDFAKIYNNK